MPITRMTTDIVCTHMNGKTVSISRSQVPVLLNFAMTDYASQGRTRPNNVVDLQNCRTHMSYYTALTRSATAEGTVIVQGFDSSKITGGTTGYQRQEFRELELLDLITKLKYEKILPSHIDGHRRNSLIIQFRQWKGLDPHPDNLHPALKWSSIDPFRMQSITTDTAWQLIKKGDKRRSEDTKDIVKEPKSRRKATEHMFVPTKGSVSIDSNIQQDQIRKLKHKVSSSCVENADKVKLLSEQDAPPGLLWDQTNWSCCYDSLFTCLHSIRLSKPRKWTKIMRGMNSVTKALAKGFNDMANGEKKYICYSQKQYPSRVAYR